jgi:hypothetical protein
MATNNKTKLRYPNDQYIQIPAATPIEQVIKILLGPPDLTTEVILSAPKDEKTKLNQKLAENDKNCYVRARAEIISKLTKSAREKIEKMEATKDIENREYKDFLKKITDLGDKLSEK